MNTRGATLLTLAAIALALYFIGFTTGAVVVVVLAAAVELWFWIKLLDHDDRQDAKNSSTDHHP
ncbi:hypothetical protein [Marinicella meishanensis]|uniref:hypothetical protein n=1 Tax=Marinicella meishanensis TaxID=2873263 RepID=UPI001CBD2B24|nr:hypothetical protein [Marinicella sp. NBU2979]